MDERAEGIHVITPGNSDQGALCFMKIDHIEGLLVGHCCAPPV
jgi:hypothetical protein